MIIPMLVCKDVVQEIDFCKTAFGAEELSRRDSKTGHVIHALLSIDGSMLMVHDESPHLTSQSPKPDGSASVVTYLYCANVDDVIASAPACGARVLLPAEDQFWGDRVGRIIDPAGHVWNIAACLKAE